MYLAKHNELPPRAPRFYVKCTTTTTFSYSALNYFTYEIITELTSNPAVAGLLSHTRLRESGEFIRSGSYLLLRLSALLYASSRSRINLHNLVDVRVELS